MRPFTGKIGLLILAIILMPVFLFSLFEIGSLKRNEKVIQEIYTNQLDAILFSVNQYSDDVINNLAGRIESVTRAQGSKVSGLQNLINEFPSVRGIFGYDSETGRFTFVYPVQIDTVRLREEIENNDSVLVRLRDYMTGGYRKIENLNIETDSLRNLVFASDAEGHISFIILAIDPREFIAQLLDPKIQEIARNSFDIVAFEETSPIPFYSSNKQGPADMAYEKRPFWLLKGYSMGIGMRGMTISGLARSRSVRNIILVAIVDIILIAAAWLLYRNIVKQLELSKLKSDFVSNVSHEIRTPLSLIRMNVETLEMGRIHDPEKIKEYYSVIMNETTRLSNIVSRILNFSKIEGNRRGYDLRPSDINEIAVKAINDMKHVMETSGFFHSFIPGRNLPLIMADSDAVADALVNLLDNAIKYSDNDKHIIVRTGRHENKVFIEVEDHGIGISEKYIINIFDKFFRINDKDMAPRTKGSGLGLSIVKHITGSHGGEVFVKSIPGEGSLFRLLFPLNNVTGT